MRNRAKCKKCGEIIESFFLDDFVYCKCGEISIEGGTQRLKCFAKDWSNFLRVDDEGNEIIPKVIEFDEDADTKEIEIAPLIGRKEKIEMLKAMADSIDRLPNHAMLEPITHSDFCSLILLLLSILEDS